MPIQPALMLIADIGGYTRFMKMQRTSLAHAHDIIARLMESVIDAAAKNLTLAKLEGDAAFFYAGYGAGKEPDLSFLSDQVGLIYRAFHTRIKKLCAANMCDCEACLQAQNLKIKFAGHFGECAVHKVKRYTELAGVDVILVHRLLKNTVPVPEYLLMTEPVLQRLDVPLQQRAAPHPMELDDLGNVQTYFLDLSQEIGEVPEVERPSLVARIAGLLGMAVRTTPFVIGIRKPCAVCRNVPLN